jgi:hypothetical protein
MQKFFQTQNTMLATALASAGVPYAEENGKRIPSLCLYHVENLARLGYKGKPLWDSAHDAWKRKRPGTIVYQFAACELLERVKSAFDGAKKTLPANPHGTTWSNIEPEDFGRIAAYLAANRTWLMDAWTLTPPLLAIYGDAVTDGNVQENSAKIISLNASEATRAKLGI